MVLDTFKCRKCGDSITFCPEDYEMNYHPTEICGFCNGGISLDEALIAAWRWGGIIEVIKMLYARWIK